MREFLARDERNGKSVSRETPVIIYAGPRDSGKSTLLEGLDGIAGLRLPCALVDCEGFSGGARNLIALLAFELNRGSGRYRRISFPRLITGLLALRVKLDDLPDTGDRKTAKERMRKALEDREKAASVLEDTVRDVIDAGLSAAGGAPTWAQAALQLIAKLGPRLVLGLLVTTRPGRRLVLGRGQDWYGRRTKQAGHDAIDVLIDLSRKAASPVGRAGRFASKARREAAATLWDAFLADLDDAFARRRRLDWTLNCLVLLDNADSTPGTVFLDELVDARKRRAEAGAAPDPLTVVAASRGPLAERHLPHGAAIAVLREAGYADYLRRRQGQPAGRWWYPVALPHLSAEDVAVMAREFKLPQGSSRDAVASAVYRYTRGHTGTARALLGAMASSGETDLATILERADQEAHDGVPLADGLLADLLIGVEEQTVHDLVTCSAARDREAVLRLGEVSGLLPALAGGEDVELLSASFWDESLPVAGRALHPVLRRLLLRRLAARDAGDPASWAVVHGWLRDISREAGDETGALYHTLARGEIEPVARWLATAVGTMDAAEDWLALLETVTSAPNNLAPWQRRADHIGALLSWARQNDALAAATARLTAAMWIDADPLSQPGRAGLHRVVLDALRRIAPHSRKGIATLLDYAEKEYGDGADWDAVGMPAAAAPAGEEYFRPPDSRRDLARKRQRRLGAAALALVVAVGTAFGVYQAVSTPPTCGATSAPFQLLWNQGECVGVTDATQYLFDASGPGADPGIENVEREIAAENRTVENSGNYVTIALLDPFTEPPNGISDVSPARIEDMLRGAYVAQEAFNASAQGTGAATSGGQALQIRLVLANEGSQGQGVQDVATQLERLTAYPGRLLAVTGMGISVQATVDAAHALGSGGANIPMFGAVTTADQLDNTTNDDLVRVVPDVHDQLSQLVKFLKRPGKPLAPGPGGKPPRVLMVYDSQTEDLYTYSLHQDFQTEFAGQLTPDDEKPYLSLRSPTGQLEMTGVFRNIADALCPSPQATPPVVLYAGRESVLDDFISQLQDDQNCQDKQVTILTGSDANALPVSATASDAGGANVTVDYADIEPQIVTTAFAREYRNVLDTTAGVTDPWMIATYNATVVAWNVISQAAANLGNEPLSQLYALNVTGALDGFYDGYNFAGAAGRFEIRTGGDLMDQSAIAIPLISLSGGGLTSLAK